MYEPVSDQDVPPRITDVQLLQLRGWGASHRQIAAMLGLRRNTVSVRLSRIDRAQRAAGSPPVDGKRRCSQR